MTPLTVAQNKLLFVSRRYFEASKMLKKNLKQNIKKYEETQHLISRKRELGRLHGEIIHDRF